LLERVPVIEKDLDDYAELVEPGTIEQIREVAAPLVGARVLHVSATAYGGGVAELLATHVALSRDVGLETDWVVLRGTDEFFHITKTIHNALQGADVAWKRRNERIYLDRVMDNAAALEGKYDFVVVHDAQPVALRELVRGHRFDDDGAKWIWRCHIDLTDANQRVWEFLRPYVEQFDASVWTMAQFVPSTLQMSSIVQAPPCIDPLSVKNLDLAEPFVAEICRSYGIDPHRPIMCQVSRFDPWKDPVGVIGAYRLAREDVPGLQLVLAGSMATDDPEGFHCWELCEKARANDRDIHLLSNLQQVGSVQVNAFQRGAGVVVQKSLREGFGLTVSEALWKGRPVVGGSCGGITLQITDGVSGYLVGSVEECAARCVEILADAETARRLGTAGREHVRREFLSTRELEDWLRLYTGLRESA